MILSRFRVALFRQDVTIRAIVAETAGANSRRKFSNARKEPAHVWTRPRIQRPWTPRSVNGKRTLRMTNPQRKNRAVAICGGRKLSQDVSPIMGESGQEQVGYLGRGYDSCWARINVVRRSGPRRDGITGETSRNTALACTPCVPIRG